MVATNRKAASKLGVTLGKNIAERRKALEWTQADLAELLGVDTETISRFERGNTLPSLLRLEALAGVLNVPLSELIVASSAHTDDQAKKISGWIAELNDDGRELALKVLKTLCVHLSK